MRLTRESREVAPVTHDEPPRWSERVRRRLRLAVAAGLAAGIVVAAIVVVSIAGLARRRSTGHRSGRSPRTSSTKAIEDLRAAPATSAVVYQQILPSLVTIETKRPSSKDGSAGSAPG